MKSLILATLLAATTIAAQQPSVPAVTGNTQGSAPASTAKKLTRAEFDQLLAKPEQLLVIDLRRPDELTSIGGFPVYLSIQSADLEKSLSWIPKDRAIVTVSNHFTRSGRAADFLAGKGFKIAGVIGAQDYESEGGKLTRIEAPKPESK